MGAKSTCLLLGPPPPPPTISSRHCEICTTSICLRCALPRCPAPGDLNQLGTPVCVMSARAAATTTADGQTMATPRPLRSFCVVHTAVAVGSNPRHSHLKVAVDGPANRCLQMCRTSDTHETFNHTTYEKPHCVHQFTCEARSASEHDLQGGCGRATSTSTRRRCEALAARSRLRLRPKSCCGTANHHGAQRLGPGRRIIIE
jgi:hypothetical protein